MGLHGTQTSMDVLLSVTVGWQSAFGRMNVRVAEVSCLAVISTRRQVVDEMEERGRRERGRFKISLKCNLGHVLRNAKPPAPQEGPDVLFAGFPGITIHTMTLSKLLMSCH